MPSPRFVFYRLLRRDQLCPGPSVCPYVQMENAQASFQPDPDPCSECPGLLLDEYMASAPGQRISSALDLDFALQIGVQVRLDEIRFSEFLLLRILNEERMKWRDDEARQVMQGVPKRQHFN